MRRIALVPTAFATLALSASPAVAQTGDGPIRAPRVLETHHVEIALPGPGWRQVVGALAGTPLLGSYRRELTPECSIEVNVSAVATRRAPRQRGRRLTVTPGSKDSLRFTVRRRGRHGSVRWWTGRANDQALAVVIGSQRLPRSLRTARRPALRTSVGINAFGREGCEQLVGRRAQSTAVRIGRSLRLAAGPVEPLESTTPA